MHRTILLAVGCAFVTAGLLACSSAPDVGPDTAPHSITPKLTRSVDGRLLLSFLDLEAQTTHLRYAEFDGQQFSVVRTVHSGSDLLQNWADFASVIPLGDRGAAAHWLVKTSAGFTYDAYVKRSADGLKWTPAQRLHEDAQLSEHGFVSLYSSTEEGLGAVWLDGNQYAQQNNVMQLRSARIDAEGVPQGESLVDERVCDCCQTAAVGGRRGVFVSYRDRDRDEVRDVSLIRRENASWSTPIRMADDGWRITGCPVNGPAISAYGDHMAVAWFTAMPSPRIRMVLSAGGSELPAPVEVAQRNVIGRVDVSAHEFGVMVSWLGAEGFQVRHFNWTGEAGDVHVLAAVNTSRRAGFPQIAVVADKLVYAWTDTSGDMLKVRAAWQTLSALGVKASDPP